MERCFEKELQNVRGGTATVCEFDLGAYVKKALSFLKEYQDEIIRGLRRGWNRF